MREMELAPDEAANATMADVKGQKAGVVRPPMDMDIEVGEGVTFVQSGQPIGGGSVIATETVEGRRVRAAFARYDARYPTPSTLCTSPESFAAEPDKKVQVIVFEAKME